MARGSISKIVQAPGGLEILYQELGEAAKSGAALAFMATLVRDYIFIELMTSDCKLKVSREGSK